VKLALSLIAVLFAAGAVSAGQSKKRILFFTKSAGFEHSVIKKKDEATPSHAEGILRQLAAKNGWELVHTKDGGWFTAENIAKTDVFFFYTTGVLTTPGTDKHPAMSEEGKAAFLKAIEDGKGYVGSHSAADTFHPTPAREDRFKAFGEKNDPYLRMVGGEFIRHGKQQKAKMTVHSPSFPGAPKEGFEMLEEWYSFKDYRDDLHVILAQETDGLLKTGGDSVYNRPAYPATWARMHGKGRVFYTSMGHREDVWTNPTFQALLEGGLKWALREVDFDPAPNVKKATPDYAVIPPEK
jgi:type 1 glutamine amidotransferase